MTRTELALFYRSNLGQPIEYPRRRVVDALGRVAGGRLRAGDHDDRQAERSRRGDLGVGGRPAASAEIQAMQAFAARSGGRV